MFSRYNHFIAQMPPKRKARSAGTRASKSGKKRKLKAADIATTDTSTVDCRENLLSQMREEG